METRLQRRRRASGLGGGGARESARRMRARRTGGGASSTTSDEGEFEACHEALAKLELLRLVLGYVGQGHFCFVAGVCKQWKASYTALYPTAETAYSHVVSSVECMNWATSQQDLELSVELFKAAAQHGDVEVCKALHGNSCPWDESVCDATLENRKHGLRVLTWLRSEDLPGKAQCPWDGNGDPMCRWAAVKGQLEMRKWLMSDDGTADLDSESPRTGETHNPVVEWLLESRDMLDENEYGLWRNAACFAAGAGLEVLEFLDTH